MFTSMLWVRTDYGTALRLMKTALLGLYQMQMRAGRWTPGRSGEGRLCISDTCHVCCKSRCFFSGSQVVVVVLSQNAVWQGWMVVMLHYHVAVAFTPADCSVTGPHTHAGTRTHAHTHTHLCQEQAWFINCWNPRWRVPTQSIESTATAWSSLGSCDVDKS